MRHHICLLWVLVVSEAKMMYMHVHHDFGFNNHYIIMIINNATMRYGYYRRFRCVLTLLCQLC